MKEATHAYIATCRECGHTVSMTVDINDEEVRADNARTVGRWIRLGYVVERVPIETARRSQFCLCRAMPRL